MQAMKAILIAIPLFVVTKPYTLPVGMEMPVLF